MSDENQMGRMIPSAKILNMRDRFLVPTLTEDGMTHVERGDLADWLANNPNERPPGSGPNGEWTVGDEEAAMTAYFRDVKAQRGDGGEPTLDYGDRPPYDVLADQLINQGYDFSPEGEEARRLADAADFIQSEEAPYNIGDVRDMLPEADAQEDMSLYLKSRKRTEGAAKKAMSGGHPEGYIVHPDGFTEVWDDPEMTAQAEKDTQQSAAQYRLNQMKAEEKEPRREGK